MDHNLLLKACLSQLANLGILTEECIRKKYFYSIQQPKNHETIELWVFLECQETIENWTCGVNCLISPDFNIQECTLVTKDIAGHITEQFHYSSPKFPSSKVIKLYDYCFDS